MKYEIITDDEFFELLASSKIHKHSELGFIGVFDVSVEINGSIKEATLINSAESDKNVFIH